MSIKPEDLLLLKDMFDNDVVLIKANITSITDIEKTSAQPNTEIFCGSDRTATMEKLESILEKLLEVGTCDGEKKESDA